ncbi:MAG: type II secretion system GspH family protein [Planctomycetaceae bacterium]|jgi:prepilin-type N-terminal cleavage/methylation domain-containing protein|nr:type II secretion system GspH family protein [Planctomycetaceae bacterium]
MSRKFIITFRTSGFTLIELLLVITILGIMSTLSISVVRQVYHTSRVEKTRTTIRKIDRVIMEMYANYDNRRVETNLSISSNASSEERARVTQAAILWCKRDLIRMEMPSNWDEIYQPNLRDGDDYTRFLFRIGGVIIASADTQVSVSPLRQLYLATYNSAIERSDADTVNHFGSAKCLYLIVMYGNPEARELFFDHEIRTDEDGLSYFVDGWGNPIYFLRWASGLKLSDRQPDISDTATSEAMSDPLDPTEVGGRLKLKDSQLLWNQYSIELGVSKDDPTHPTFHGWTLLPVIMSSGGYTGGNAPAAADDAADDGFWRNFGVQLYPTDDTGKKIPALVVDPFHWQLGAPLSNGANHNIIHNHMVLR